jgi:hypothetical protein
MDLPPISGLVQVNESAVGDHIGHRAIDRIGGIECVALVVLNREAAIRGGFASLR